jgi:glycosyltransferase involved in cell wall biosynthesis
VKIGVYVAGANCAQYARACVNSLTAQTFVDWRAVVSVDKGEDCTHVEARQAALGDDRIKVVIKTTKIHSCAAKLHAIEGLLPILKDDDILVGLDLDDRLEPDALEKIIDRHAAGAWATYGNWKDQNGAVNKIPPKTHDLFDRIRSAPWFLTAPNTFRVKVFERIPRDFFRWNGTDRYYETGFDGSAMFAVADLVGFDRIEPIHDPIYVYNRLRPESVLRSWPEKHRKALFAEQRRKPKLEALP